MGSRGEAPAGGLGDGVPQKLEHFLKYTAWNLRPGENESHNLMPLMAFFIELHTRIVLFRCHVGQCSDHLQLIRGGGEGHGPLASPKSALVCVVGVAVITGSNWTAHVNYLAGGSKWHAERNERVQCSRYHTHTYITSDWSECELFLLSTTKGAHPDTN